MSERPQAQGPQGRRLVEPPGYVVGSFVSAAAIVAGIGLAPNGLLLFAAACILSVIEWRRFRAANPWLTLETPDDFRSPEGQLFLRWSSIGTGINVALAIGALVLVQLDGRDAGVLGPALVAGVVTIAINYLLKLGVAKLDAGGPSVPHDDRFDEDEDAVLLRGRDDDAREAADADEPGFAGHAPPLEQPRKARREPKAAKPAKAPREPKRPREPRRPDDDAPTGEPHETAPHEGDPDDGFVEQDDRALNGPRIEPPQRSKSRPGRPDKDDRRY